MEWRVSTAARKPLTVRSDRAPLARPAESVIATLSLMSIIHGRQLFINISPFHLEDEQELWGSLLLGITLLTKLAQCLGRKAVGL